MSKGPRQKPAGGKAWSAAGAAHIARTATPAQEIAKPKPVTDIDRFLATINPDAFDLTEEN